MARSVKAGKTGIKQKKDKFEVTFPSRYGSHATMVVDLEGDEAGKAFLGDRVLAEDEVLCKDEQYYVTFKNRLDTGAADPNRIYKA